MSDETVQTETPATEPVATAEDQKRFDDADAYNASQAKEPIPPYHTKETWAAAKERTEAVKSVEPKDFSYSYNGYDVKAVEATGGTRGDENGLVYEVTQGDFKKTFTEKRDAVLFVETHSSDFAKNA